MTAVVVTLYQAEPRSKLKQGWVSFIPICQGCKKIGTAVPAVLRKVSVQKEGLAKNSLVGIFWALNKQFWNIDWKIYAYKPILYAKVTE